MYDSANRKDIRRAEKAAKLAENQEREIVKGLMSLAAGRQWVHDLLVECAIFHTPFTGDDSTTAFNCGKQSVGLKLFNQVVSVCPNEYMLMMQERNLRDASRDAAASRRQSPSARSDGDVEGSGAEEPDDGVEESRDPDPAYN